MATNLVIFGADGRVGSRIVGEAARRGHLVTAVTRHTGSGETIPGVTYTIGDAASPPSAAALADGADVLISAVGGPDKSVYVRVAQNLVATASAIADGAPRIVHSGGGGSLLNDDGLRFVDARIDLPADLRAEMLGQAAALDYYRTTTGVTWTYLSPPPGNFAPGERRGSYRTGTDHPVLDEHGNFGISMEDYAIAIIDEIETPRYLNLRFTVGY